MTTILSPVSFIEDTNNRPLLNNNFTSSFDSNFEDYYLTPNANNINSNIIYPLWLRDIYGIITEEPIYNLDDNVINKDEYTFLAGDDIFNYISKTIRNNHSNYYIKFVITSLRDLLWNNRSTLSYDVSSLEQAMKSQIPTFKSISDENSLYNLYKLSGDITPYNVLTIDVFTFVQLINNKQPITLSVNGANFLIQLNYTLSDFWDYNENKIIDKINI